MKYLTFVVPCFNSQDYMERCINSLLVGGTDVEVIIIDDGSTDNTGKIANYYKNKPVYTPKPAALDVMSKNAQVRASSTRWLIMTDTSACQVGVYSGSYGNWSRVALWSCGPGKPSTPTVKGEFTIYGRGKSFGSRSYTCWYYTQFYGNYLFHSVLYNRGSMTQIQDGTLGKQVSHGCVRLDINNAKWLYDNIPNGTKVVIY